MWGTSRWLRTGRNRATFCQGRPLEMARTSQQPWQGTSLWIRSLCTSTAKVPSRQSMAKAQSLGSTRAHVWNRLLFSHDEVRAVKVKGHATESDVEAGRTSHLCKRGNDFADTFAKKGQTHTSPLFASPRQSLRVLPWPSKRHDGPPRRTFCSGSGGGTTPRLQRHDQGYGRRERDSSASGTRRLQRRLLVRSPTGFLSFSLTFLARQSPRQSHIQRAQLAIGTSFDAGGRALGNAIIFCAKCGAVYWERADALCRQCNEFPGGRTSQLRKLRSGLFPEQTLPWLDSRTRSSAHIGRGYHSGGAAGILRGWSGSYGHGAHNTQKATGGPSGSGASTLGKCWSGCRQQ